MRTCDITYCFKLTARARGDLFNYKYRAPARRQSLKIVQKICKNIPKVIQNVPRIQPSSRIQHTPPSPHLPRISHLAPPLPLPPDPPTISTMSSPLITLSPSIRDWVVLPMLLLMVLTMLLRAGTGPLLRSAKSIPAEDRKVRKREKKRGRATEARGTVLTWKAVL